jgi:hypothetical protein
MAEDSFYEISLRSLTILLLGENVLIRLIRDVFNLALSQLCCIAPN